MKTTTALKQELQQGIYDDVLKELYKEEALLSKQKERYQKSISNYETLFGEGEVELYSAPGRSEIGGNHTDHQHGEVLAASVNLDAIAIVGYLEEPCIKLVSEGYELITISLDDLTYKEQEKGTSAGLIRGMAYGLKEKGFEVKGFQAYVTSDVLIGAGLSSSAAFETLLGTIISGLFHQMKISPVLIAQVAQYAENVYFGKPCGLMDQMACSVGGFIHIDFADPTHPVVEQVLTDLKKHHYNLCIVDTKGSHADLTEEYAEIPAEMKQVATFFDKKVLREVDEQKFMENISKIRTKIGDRPVLRAIHFFAENMRVEEQVKALKEERILDFLSLIKASGHSSFQYLQNVYTNRDSKNQNVSIALAVSESILGNKGVARVHGGGFAGTIQAFVLEEFVPTYQEKMNQIFGENACHVLNIRPVGGTRVLF